MTSLVTRFHLLLFAVTVAITGVAVLRVPADFLYAAHWSGSVADWQWPRDGALMVAPALAALLLLAFFGMGRMLTRNHFAKTQHIFEPALTLVLGVVAGSQLGLLLAGVGSDLDLIRLIGFALGVMLVGLGVVLFEAERHTYAGLRLPWLIAGDATWRLAHRVAGAACALAGAALLALAWLDVGIGILMIGFAAALTVPPILAGVVTVLLLMTGREGLS